MKNIALILFALLYSACEVDPPTNCGPNQYSCCINRVLLTGGCEMWSCRPNGSFCELGRNPLLLGDGAVDGFLADVGPQDASGDAIQPDQGQSLVPEGDLGVQSLQEPDPGMMRR